MLKLVTTYEDGDELYDILTRQYGSLYGLLNSTGEVTRVSSALVFYQDVGILPAAGNKSCMDSVGADSNSYKCSTLSPVVLVSLAYGVLEGMTLQRESEH
jgi:hypothetical protein